jgi:hypothetical protein
LTEVQSNSELEIEDIDYENQRVNRPNQNVLNTLRTRRSDIMNILNETNDKIDKVFSNPDLLSHISSYNTGFKKGGLTKRHHKISKKNKNKHSKRTKSRRYRKSRTTRRFSKK